LRDVDRAACTTIEPLNDDSPGASHVELPPYVQEPFEVYLNGIPQQAGVDFDLIGRTLVFPRELVAEVKMSKVQWALVTVGIGSYKKHDSVDVIYQHDGRRLVASGLQARTV
jgi:hypothetical protein